jgi:hypothetical protein
MGSEPTPESKAEVDPVFEDQIKKLRERAKDEAEARTGGDSTQWNMPDLQDWDGDLFAIEEISDAFKREDANDKFEEAVKDATNPGVAADLGALTLQVDYLGCMERAFRARHASRRPRTMAHMTGRRKGHGDERGTLTQMDLEFVRNLVKQAKASEGGS